MFGSQLLEINPIKGVAYRLYFRLYANSPTYPQLPKPGLSDIYIGISKDAGSVALSTNSVVEISNGSGEYDVGGWYYIDLTATEMNADVICISINNDARSAMANAIIIKTVVDELSAIPSKSSTLSQKVTAIFQYLFFKRTMTTSAETLYKDDGSTSLGSNTVSDNGTTVTKGKIS
jgi:hypothetical protein